jgi:hypothetical protein
MASSQGQVAYSEDNRNWHVTVIRVPGDRGGGERKGDRDRDRERRRYLVHCARFHVTHHRHYISAMVNTGGALHTSNNYYTHTHTHYYTLALCIHTHTLIQCIYTMPGKHTNYSQ